MNDLNKHEKRDKVKWGLTFTAFVLIAVLLAGLVLQVFGSGKWQPSNWFRQDGTADETGVLGDDGEILSSGEVYEMPARLAFRTSAISAAGGADNVTIHATVTPADTTFAELVWSVTFTNPQSEWAQGKNAEDYVTVSLADPADTHVVVVKCMQPFGEQIIVTAAGAYYPEITKSVTVDYMCDITFTGVAFFQMQEGFRGFTVGSGDDLDEELQKHVQEIEDGGSLLVNFQDNGKERVWDDCMLGIRCGVGTIAPPVKVRMIFKYSEEFYNLAVPFQSGTDWSAFPQEEGGIHKSFDIVPPEITEDGHVLDGDTQHNGYGFWIIPISGLGFCWAYNPSAIIGIEYIAEFRAAVKAAFEEDNDLLIGTLTFDFYDGRESRYIGQVNCRIDPETVLNDMESIGFDTDEGIVFGG